MIRVIIVDDEILSRMGVQSFIDGKNEILVEATFESAEDAILYLEKNQIDIVITDIEMAEMNGLDFIKKIRENQLARGVIILSCHDDFSYAQEAIANGTDSYLLKYSITEETLVREIEKVYKKIAKSKNSIHDIKKSIQEAPEFDENSKYKLILLHVENTIDGSMVDSSLLEKLLENLMARNNIGTLFSPYDKEMFMLLSFEKTCKEEDIKEKIIENLTLIDGNLEQYISSRMIYCVSKTFSELSEIKKMHKDAMSLLQMLFYHNEQNIFFVQDNCLNDTILKVQFSRNVFLKTEGLQQFESELQGYLRKAKFDKIDVQSLKNQLIQALISFKTEIIKEANISSNLAEKYQIDSNSITMINLANTDTELMRVILSLINEFRKDIIWEFENDEMSDVLLYIDKHLSEKIVLNDLADISRMSVPTFTKKFKERTGVTLVQYLNNKRIGQVQQLLKNKNYSLWTIAEKTGFSNTNYMVRVFKKVTKQTVSEYRKQYGIIEHEL